MRWDTAGLTIAARISAPCSVLSGQTLKSQVFEGRLAGQFGVYGGRNSAGDLIDDYFVPDGEAVALASLAVDARQRYSDVERAFEALREGLSD